MERAIGELYLAGDRACETGDVAVLADIAEQLVEHLDEPRHCELVPLARACADPEAATAAWTQLKALLWSDLA